MKLCHLLVLPVLYASLTQLCSCDDARGICVDELKVDLQGRSIDAVADTEGHVTLEGFEPAQFACSTNRWLPGGNDLVRGGCDRIETSTAHVSFNLELLTEPLPPHVAIEVRHPDRAEPVNVKLPVDWKPSRDDCHTATVELDLPY